MGWIVHGKPQRRKFCNTLCARPEVRFLAMSPFENREFRNHELVVFGNDEPTASDS